jgi:F0F1-type ATP synthase assembly protein I
MSEAENETGKKPKPEKPPQGEGALRSLVEAEKLVQIGLLIPSATFIGWLAGAGLDHLLHRSWIYLPGLLLGATAGFVQMFRTVLRSTKE